MISFLAVHSADEHRMIYSFSNTTSYSTFYGFFSSFRITLRPMWLANSKRQPCFYPPQSNAQEDTQNWQKNWQTWWETCAVPEIIQFSFSCSFFTQLNCTVLLRVYGATLAMRTSPNLLYTLLRTVRVKELSIKCRLLISGINLDYIRCRSLDFVRLFREDWRERVMDFIVFLHSCKQS